MFSLIKSESNGWMRLVIIAFPIIFLTIGLSSLHDVKTKTQLCRDEVIAEISRITESSDDDGVSYNLYFTYVYKDNTYNVKDGLSSSSYSKYNVGDKVSLLVNPDNPEMFLFDTDSLWFFTNAFMISGIGIYGLYAIIDVVYLISHIITKKNTCS